MLAATASLSFLAILAYSPLLKIYPKPERFFLSRFFSPRERGGDAEGGWAIGEEGTKKQQRVPPRMPFPAPIGARGPSGRASPPACSGL